MAVEAYDKYRPQKTSDGRGGSTISLGTAGTVWGEMIVSDAKVSLVVDIREDIQIGDIVEVEEQ